ncbi:MAG TPA: TonB-dependent receptor [Longimicrobiales bacterium]
MTPILALILTFAAPQEGTVRGMVRVQGTLEPIAGATVRIPDLGRMALTDARGYFVFADVPAGQWRVVASALGYREHEVTVALEDGTVRLDFELPVQPVPIAGLEVEDPRSATLSLPRAPGPSAIRLDVSSLDVLPGLAEPDVLRAVQLLPSVAAASDFSSALYMRGGSPDQTLITLDGVPLTNPYHLGGLFSAIPFDAVSAVDVMPGALPASAGDRLSGQVDIHTREGGRDRVRGSGTIGLISAHVTASAPLPGGEGAVLVAARRTYLDVATAAAHALDLLPARLPYGFSDVYMKVTRDVGELGSISLSAYLNGEYLDIGPEEADTLSNGTLTDLGWGSRLVALSYRQPVGRSLLFRGRLGYTDFRGDFDASEVEWSGSVVCGPAGCEPVDVVRDSSLLFRGRSRARDVVLGVDLSWFGRRHTLELGAQLDAYRFAHRLELGDVDDDLVSDVEEASRLRTTAAYIEDSWQMTDALDLRAGIRFLDGGRLGSAWLPRAGSRLHVTPRLRFSLGGGAYAQAVRSMRDEESALASLIAYDVPSVQPDAAGLARGEDVVAGIEWESGPLFLRADAFAKRMRGLVLGPDAASPLDAPVLVTDSFRIGRGRVRGLELLARYRRGRTDITLSYALQSAELDVAGETYPPRYERRHLLMVAAALPLGETGTLGAQLALGSGQPYSPAIGLTTPMQYDPRSGLWLAPSSVEVVLGERNSARLPGYLRLDVAARKRFEKRWFGRRVSVTPYFQVLNVLNTRNVLLAEPQPHGVRGPALSYWPQLPFFPTFGVQWSF